MNHGVLCWWLGIMVSDDEPMIENRGVLCRASGCESWCVMVSQWLGVIVYYAEAVGVNHGELCSASGCESRCVMLSEWL